MTREQLIREIAAKIKLACALTNAHARKLQRLVDEFIGMTRQYEPPISELSAEILDFIRRAS